MRQLHPLFQKLLDKLQNPKYSVLDCTGERMDWIKAGCPIYQGRVSDISVRGHTENC